MEGAIARRLARYIGRVMRPLPPTRSIVSFTFDDVPSSACTTAADMVAAADARATFYVSGGLDRDTGGSGGLDRGTRTKYHSARELRRLCEDGHEIGCHGFYHLNYQSVSIEKVEADIATNRAYFVEHGLPIPTNFAYPYGCVDRVVKRTCARLFTSCRGVQNEINHGNVDLALLKAVPLFSHQLTAARIDTLLSRLMKSGLLADLLRPRRDERPGPLRLHAGPVGSRAFGNNVPRASDPDDRSGAEIDFGGSELCCSVSLNRRIHLKRPDQGCEPFRH